MKKIFALLFALSIVIISNAQNQKDTTGKWQADSVATIDTPLLSVNDIFNLLGEFPLKCAEPIRNAIAVIINQREIEYNAKKKLERQKKSK